MSVVTPESLAQCTPITVTYRNHRGSIAVRTIIPKMLWFGATEWHPEPGWLLRAYDLGKMADRDFSVADMDFTGAIERACDAVEDYCSDMPDLAGHGHSNGLKDAIRESGRKT